MSMSLERLLFAMVLMPCLCCVLEGVLGWFLKNGVRGHVCYQPSPSTNVTLPNETSDDDDGFSFESSSELDDDPIDPPVLVVATTEDDDDGWLMPSPNGRHSRQIKPKHVDKRKIRLNHGLLIAASYSNSM